MIGSVASDVASGSSGNQHDAKKSAQYARPTNGASVVGRNSTSSPTVVEANADSSAIDPLSQVSQPSPVRHRHRAGRPDIASDHPLTPGQHIIKRTNTQKSIPLKLLGRASYEAEAGGVDHRHSVDQGPIRGDAVLHKKPSREKK